MLLISEPKISRKILHAYLLHALTLFQVYDCVQHWFNPSSLNQCHISDIKHFMKQQQSGCGTWGFERKFGKTTNFLKNKAESPREFCNLVKLKEKKMLPLFCMNRRNKYNSLSTSSRLACLASLQTTADKQTVKITAILAIFSCLGSCWVVTFYSSSRRMKILWNSFRFYNRTKRFGSCWISKQDKRQTIERCRQ